MKKVFTVLAAALALTGLAAFADDSDAVAQAQAAATSWLALTDGGKFGESWDASSSLSKAAVTRADWEKAMKAGRGQLGAMKARKVRSATFTRTMPGAPDGAYVVIQFESQFENKAAAIETVTPMREKDGAWRVSGYYIR